MTELLPCPFCGGPALFEYVRSGGTMSSGMEPPTCYAGCKKCGVRFSGGETQGWDSTRRWYDRMEEAHGKAAENWNHRHSTEIAGALRDAERWRSIESAPFADLQNTHPIDCLVWSPKIGGVRVGRVWRYPDGEPCGQAVGYSGEWEITHWRPLPAPPTQDTAMQHGGGGGEAAA